jgi:hypothetical protein
VDGGHPVMNAPINTTQVATVRTRSVIYGPPVSERWTASVQTRLAATRAPDPGATRRDERLNHSIARLRVRLQAPGPGHIAGTSRDAAASRGGHP